MHTARRRRSTVAIAASLIVHLAVALAVLSQRPPDVPAEPPVISVLLVERPPPSANARLIPPAPLRLHLRPQPVLPPQIPTAPFAPPAPSGATTAPTPGPVAVHPAPLPTGPKGDARTALRQSYVGCANRDRVGLNRAERDFCDEQFGKGAKDAKFAGLGLDADKMRQLDAAVAKKEADYSYKRGAVPNAGGPGGPLGADPREAKIPF
jgi:hypothetical protein